MYFPYLAVRDCAEGPGAARRGRERLREELVRVGLEAQAVLTGEEEESLTLAHWRRAVSSCVSPMMRREPCRCCASRVSALFGSLRASPCALSVPPRARNRMHGRARTQRRGCASCPRRAPQHRWTPPRPLRHGHDSSCECRGEGSRRSSHGRACTQRRGSALATGELRKGARRLLRGCDIGGVVPPPVGRRGAVEARGPRADRVAIVDRRCTST